MKAYLLTLSGVIILSAIVSILISDGKMGKFIKGMTRLFVFSVVIVPLVSVFEKKELAFSAAEIGTDEGYLLRCAELLSEQDEEEISRFLSEEYAVSAWVEIEREIEDHFPRKKITVIIYESGIFGQDEHINMIDCMKSVLEEKYGCVTEVVWRENASAKS